MHVLFMVSGRGGCILHSRFFGGQVYFSFLITGRVDVLLFGLAIDFYS